MSSIVERRVARNRNSGARGSGGRHDKGAANDADRPKRSSDDRCGRERRRRSGSGSSGSAGARWCRRPPSGWCPRSRWSRCALVSTTASLRRVNVLRSPTSRRIGERSWSATISTLSPCARRSTFITSRYWPPSPPARTFWSRSPWRWTAPRRRRCLLPPRRPASGMRCASRAAGSRLACVSGSRSHQVISGCPISPAARRPPTTGIRSVACSRNGCTARIKAAGT